MTATRVFVSYSHRDPEYLGSDSLLGFLRGLEAEEGVEFWTDERLEAGTFWDDEIQKRLRDSDIALVLVSQSFLDSSYCSSVEMSTFLGRCREEGLIIFPVILSPCEWERHEWLASRQFLPSGGETIEEHYGDPGRRKRLFLKIRQELRGAIVRARERVKTESPAAAPRVQQLAERRQLTILRCDLVPTEPDGSPLGAEDLPEILHELAPEFLRAASLVFEQYEGHVAQTGGGAMEVIFGFPSVHEDDSRRAIRAGLALVETVGKLSPRMEKDAGVRLTVRVGVHSGTVIASADAAPGESVVDSDMTTTASRIQEAAPANSVLVSEATHRLVADFFEIADAGAVNLPKSKQVAAYRIVSDTGHHSRMHASGEEGLTPLTGRAQELALLLDQWSDARDGNGQVVLLRAEAGIGKSRLLAEIRRRTEDEKRAWIECRCSPYHRNTEFFPIRTCFELWFGLETSDDDAMKLAKIEQRVERYGPLAQLVPPLASVLSVPYVHKYAVTGASPAEQKELTLQVMVQLLTEITADTPAVFVVEDLHWADPSTAEFLDLLLEQSVTMPVLVLLAFRPEFAPPPQWLNRGNVSQIALDRLGRESAEEMVRAITGGKPLPREVLDEIFAKTEGFPLFIEDLTSMVLESDLVVDRGDRYELAGPFHALSIPDTLQETLMARLAKLATAKPVAQIGATIGREFVFDMLREVGGFDDKVLTEELNRLVQAGLLYKRGLLSRAKYIFKHALVQEALHQSLLKKQRRQYHKVIATVLEEKFRDIAESQPELVAQHYEEGAMPEKAFGYWNRAAERSLARGANREALSLARRAIETLEAFPEETERFCRELDLRMIEGPALLALKGWASPELGACYARARELCARLPKTRKMFETLRGLWTNDMVAARLHQALAAAEELHSMATEAADNDLLMESHAAICDTLNWLGRPVDCLAHARAGFALYDCDAHHAAHSVAYGEDPAGMFYTYGCMSLNLLGRRREAQQLADEAVQLVERYTHQFSRVFLLAGITWNSIEHGDADTALVYAQRMLDLAVEHHFEAFNAVSTFWKGWAIASGGDLDAGLALMVDGRQRWHAGGAGVETCWFAARLAELCLAGGRAEEALRWVEEGLSLARTNDDRCYLSELHRLKAETLAALGAGDEEIAAQFDAALRISGEQKAAVLSLRAAVSLARHGGNDAWRVLNAACSAYQGDEDTPELVAARALIDRMAEGRVDA
jgi:class 3 adenylate cyclase